MNRAEFLLHLDRLSLSYLVIVVLVAVALLAGLLFWIGLIPWCLRHFASGVRISIHRGFLLWEQLFSWASWPTFLSMVLASLLVGWMAAPRSPVLTIICASIPMFMGVTACLAYMMIDLERYAVSRGHKAVHNPLKGQELAVNLVRYGQAVGVPLLAAATVGTVGGFAMLNLGLYLTVGRDWYGIHEEQFDATYVDFLANALMVLLRIVDVLDFARASRLLDISYVKQSKWPATALLTVFRMFFTLVLLQQVFASIRKGQVLSETISDLWNPNEPIHERACHALPQFGPSAVGPLLMSLGEVASLTKEQRERLTEMVESIGPTAIPSLVQHLYDAPEHVRAIAVASLGRFRIRGTIMLLAPLGKDSSDIVRQSLIDALGDIASPGAVIAETTISRPASKSQILRTLNWKPRPVDVPITQPVDKIDPIELAVKILVNALNDESLSVRTSAARSLGLVGPEAVSAIDNLIELLGDEDESVRFEAMIAVRKVGGPSAKVIEALVQRLDDPSDALRTAAAHQLGMLGEKASAASSALVPLLQDREETVRDAAAEAIGRIGHIDDDVADEMAEGLASPDSLVRAQTAEVLGAIGEPAQETAPALVDALDDENDLVRAKAVEALGKIGEAVAGVAVPGLVRALHDEDNVVSSLAAEALGEMGDSAEMAIPSLVESLEHINADVRASAAESLGKLEADESTTREALERACQDEDADVRREAIRALGLIAEPSESNKCTVLFGLDDLDADVRLAAINALCDWNQPDEKVLAGLTKLLDDPNEKVRIEIVRSLPRLGGPSSELIAELCERFKDDTDSVQAEVAKALGEMGPAAADAGIVLLRAAQTSNEDVREQAISAIKRIRPSEVLLARGGSDVDLEAFAALEQIESESTTQTQESAIDVIPIIVAPLVNPETGQPMNVELNLVLVPTETTEADQTSAELVHRSRDETTVAGQAQPEAI